MFLYIAKQEVLFLWSLKHTIYYYYVYNYTIHAASSAFIFMHLCMNTKQMMHSSTSYVLIVVYVCSAHEKQVV